MPNKAYSDDEKLRILAIASVRGLAAACRQFRVNHETVRAWQAERGDDHALQLAYDLALSELTVDIAEGKNRHKLSTHVGILRDKLARYPQPKIDPARAVEDAFLRARERYRISAVIALRVANRMGESLDELITAMETYIGDPSTETLALIALQAYHQDHGCELRDGEPGQWRDECPAPLGNIWTYLDSLGYLDDWLEARRVRQHDEMEVQLAANQRAKEAAMTAALDAETRRLLDAAEEWLAQSRETHDAA